MIFSIPVVASAKLQHLKLHLNSTARTQKNPIMERNLSNLSFFV